MRHNWKISTDSSYIAFSLKFYEIGRIKGYVRKFDGDIVAGEDFDKPDISFQLFTDSISTLNEKWDRKLSSPLFMSAEEFPIVAFASKDGCQLSTGGIQELTGQLTIKSHTATITLLVTSASVKSTSKRKVSQYNLTTKLVMSDYGFKHSHKIFGNEINLNMKIMLVADVQPQE